MKKKNIVKDSKEFTRIIHTIRPYRGKGFLIYIDKSVGNSFDKNDFDYQFGITISNKVGHAVVRNRIKRQIKSIIDKNNYQNSFKCIIIIKREILEKNYHDLENDLNYYFHKGGILEEKDEQI